MTVMWSSTASLLKVEAREHRSRTGVRGQGATRKIRLDLELRRAGVRKFALARVAHTIRCGWGKGGVNVETMSENTRETARVDFFEPVRILIGNDQRLCLFGLDLSADGMRLRSNQPLKRGSRISLEFKTPRGPIKVDEAEVIWSEPFQAINVDGTVPGFGVKFVSVNENAKELLAGHIAESEPSGPRRLGAKGTAASAPRRTPLPAPAPTDSAEMAPPTVEEGSPHAPDASVVVQHGLASEPSQFEGEPAPLDMPLVPGFDIDPSSEASSLSALDEPWPPRRARGGDANRVASLASKLLAGLLILAGVVGVVIAIRGSDAESDRLLAATPRESTPGHSSPQAGVDVATPGAAPRGLPRGTVAPPVVSAPVVSSVPRPSADAKPTAHKVEARNSGKPSTSPARTVAAKPTLASYLPGGMELKNAADSWTLTIRGTSAIKARTFALNQPARFVVDVMNPDYRGKAFSVEPGVKGVGEIRVRTGEESTRYVVDFAGGRVPASTVTRNGDRLVIRFENAADVSKLAAR